MKNLLIISALSIESKEAKKICENIKIKDLKISFLTTGVGNLNVIYSLKDYFDKKQVPDFVLNIGTCGTKTGKEMSYFQVCRVKNLSNNKESLPPVYLKLSRIDEILCSDKVITNNEIMGDFEYVDMESFGIDFICSKENIPFIMLKKPFDIVGNNSKNLDLSDLQKSFMEINFIEILNNIAQYLEKNSPIFSQTELSKFKTKFKLTFSEFEIFKKFLNKSIAFGKEKNEILKELRKLEKIEFLEKIKRP